MPSQIISTKSAEHYKWGGPQAIDCDGWHLVKTPELSIIEELMPAGAREVRHSHIHARQFFFVLEGELTLEVDHHSIVLHPREGLEISPGQNHQASNRSTAPARFLVTSQPPSHGDRIIAAHRANEDDSGDLLSMLMQARDEDGGRMGDKQLRDEVLTFLLAGHETTALALSWTWHLLGQYPGAEARLHEELDRVLAGRAPEFSDLRNLSYAERVIKEYMRLYPPAWGVARTVVKDFEIGGYRIPAGSNVVMSQWVMHRDPRFFDQPEAFLPERWSNDLAGRLPRYVYFPFGAGPRRCIGEMFAMMETILTI